MIGETISHYRIDEQLGEGGMGVVYRALDLALDRPVALKFLAPHFAGDEDGRKRFIREAKAAAAIDHPNICTVYEIGEAEGRTFIAMAFLDGRPLSDLIAQGPLKLNDALSIAMQMAEGLDAAHTKGIVHRDIKPGNVMLVQGTRRLVKLVDFGLALLAGSSKLTLAGSSLGTTSYMSPEQASGGQVDHRTDIWSLGVVLYEMVSGRTPFQADFNAAVIYALINENPEPLTTLRTGVPMELERITNKCLAKDPNSRYQHLDELLVDLRELDKRLLQHQSSAGLIHAQTTRTDHEPQFGKPVAPVIAQQRRAVPRWLPWVLVGLVVMGVAAVLLTQRSERVETAVLPLTVRPIDSLPGRKQFPIFSNDGNAIVFAWDGGQEGQNSDVYLMQVDAGRPIQITNHPASEWPACFSPDGRRLYFIRQSESGSASYSVPALGGDESRVAEGIVTDISPDGRFAVLGRLSGSAAVQNGVFVRDLTTGVEQRLAEDLGASNPQFSLDGQWVLLSQGPNRDRPSLHRIPVGGGTPELVQFSELGDDIERVESIEFSPGRTRMRIVARQIATNELVSFMANGDGSDPRRLPGKIPLGPLSPDGRRMVSVRNSFRVPLYRVEAFPSRDRPAIPEKVMDTEGEAYSPRISPDGSRMLVASVREGIWAIWLWNITMSEGHPVFNKPGGTAGSPTWSPDGKWIAFDARPTSTAGEVWLMPASGGDPKVLVDRPIENFTPCFDPTSQWVYFTSTRTGTLQLFKVPVSGGSATQVTQGGGFRCQFSADGRYIYYLKTRSGGEIWRIDLTTNQEEPVVPEMKSSNWKVLPDGIYFMDSGVDSQRGTASRPGDARFYRFSTKKIEELDFRTPKPVTHIGIEISPDRKWLYYSQVDSATSNFYVVENLP